MLEISTFVEREHEHCISFPPCKTDHLSCIQDKLSQNGIKRHEISLKENHIGRSIG